MKKYLLLFLPILLLVNISCFSQAGGFYYGWDNYDQSDTAGLGNRLITFDNSHVRDIPHAPEFGIHPRIFFGPDEIPAIRQRLDSLESGQAVAAQLHAFTTLMVLGSPAYDSNAEYARDQFDRPWIGNVGFWNTHDHYQALVDEDITVWDGVDVKRKHMTACMMALAAFECLIYEGETDADTGQSYAERATQLAGAMAFWASLAIDDPLVNPNSNNFNHFGGTHMALAYDLNYHAMSEEQRELVRTALAKIIPEVPRHGGQLSAYVATSNWATLNSFEIICNMALEGEAGYQPELTRQWMKALHNFITYGWYPSGAGYEGLGKNYQFVTTLIACAKRGYSLLGHPHVAAYGKQFLPAITQPFGHGFTSYDVWGGSGHDPVIGGYKFSPADVIGLKWIFPDDPKIDWVWRNYIERSHDYTEAGYRYQMIRPDDSYYNYLLPAAIFAQDYNHENWEEQANTQAADDYLAADRGLGILRSGKEADALAVQFHCRQDMGGHTHGDRNDFTLSALGRIWVRKSYGGSQFQPSWFHSMVLVDGKGVAVGDPDGDKCRQPGKLLHWSSAPEIASIAGDATYAYTWDWHWSAQTAENDHPWITEDAWEAVMENWNDFQYEPSTEAHYNLPFYEFPHWHVAGHYERMVKRLHNPMEKVYRTLALVRAHSPYVLIADDLKKDEDVHQYTWLAQIARDLSIAQTEVDLDLEDYKCDIILQEPETTGNRRLLVRILHNEGYDNSEPPAILDTLDYFDYFNGNSYNANPNYIRPRLRIENNSISPDFKVMLYPHEAGSPLPITTWNSSKDTLRVIWPNNETETIAFTSNTQGRTEIEWVDFLNTTTIPSSEITVQIFPNPSKGSSIISGTSELLDGAQLSLYTTQGQLLKQWNLPGSSTTIVWPDLPSGHYVYTIAKGATVIDSGKLILE